MDLNLSEEQIRAVRSRRHSSVILVQDFIPLRGELNSARNDADVDPLVQVRAVMEGRQMGDSAPRYSRNEDAGDSNVIRNLPISMATAAQVLCLKVMRIVLMKATKITT